MRSDLDGSVKMRNTRALSGYAQLIAAAKVSSSRLVKKAEFISTAQAVKVDIEIHTHCTHSLVN